MRLTVRQEAAQAGEASEGRRRSVSRRSHSPIAVVSDRRLRYHMADLSLRFRRCHRRSYGRQQKGRCREDKGRVVGGPVGGSIGRPVAGCRPRLLAFQRGSASGCSGTVSPIGNGRFRRAHSPVIDSSGALGAANHPFPSTAGSVDSGPIGTKGDAVDHDAARSPAARAATGRDTPQHRRPRHRQRRRAPQHRLARLLARRQRRRPCPQLRRPRQPRQRRQRPHQPRHRRRCPRKPPCRTPTAGRFRKRCIAWGIIKGLWTGSSGR